MNPEGGTSGAGVGLCYDDLAIRDSAEHEWNNIVTGAYDAAKAATTSQAPCAYCKPDTLVMEEIAQTLRAIA